MSHPPRVPEMMTPRLRLRRQTVEDAAVFRHLWTERDERVPAHRRLDADGRPDLDDVRAHIRDAEGSSLLTVECTDTGEPIGYCGLVYGGDGVGDEPELAFELLRAEHNRGYATEAAQAVLAWAVGAGFDRVWAGVWEWNLPSRRVLQKLGFVESGRERPSSVHGRNILTVKTICAGGHERPDAGG
ncbi:GNAT family N-acetyltransferase [Microbacterium paraoxydans]|uniref:GNAT family N-acetyltransferase n=1 Tax=Microbacterium paraoxydans TaxID=199592 RepID=UPI0030136899